MYDFGDLELMGTMVVQQLESGELSNAPVSDLTRMFTAIEHTASNLVRLHKQMLIISLLIQKEILLREVSCVQEDDIKGKV